MKFTEHYRLGSVVAGGTLDPIEDSRRFLVIDRQLLGLYQVFGNGVVTGWDVSNAGGLSVAISPGRGHVFFESAMTPDVRTVTGLVGGATNYIYAQAVDTTRLDRDVVFFADTTLFNGSNTVLLAAVSTNAATVTSIDTSVRNDISFIEEIKNLINQHRHRGGNTNPTKIDLTKEVMGQLPGFHVDSIDASNIATGRIPIARIPPLEHSELLNSGVLTHAQLDSFVRNLSNPNARLLGELAASDMMQMYLAMKHIWNEVDLFTTNMVVMIPGITPDQQTDFTHSTAIIDKCNHLIQGVPSLSGQLTTTTFRTVPDFSSATLQSNIVVSPDILGTGAVVQLTKPFSQLIVDSFDNVFQTGIAIPGWTVSTVPTSDNTSFDSDSSQKVDGAFSVKFTIDQSIRVQALKVFSQTQDWSPYNELQAYIETLSADHGRIVFQILSKDSAGVLKEIDSFTLLGNNETTVGFRQVSHDISTLARTKVDAINIYTDTSQGWDLAKVVLNLDQIRLNNNLFFNQSGRLRLRLRTPQKSQWAAISWTGQTNGGTIQARARTAPNYETFDQSSAAPFGSFFSISGSDPKVADNLATEVEIALSASTDRTTSPTLNSVTVSYITNSTNTGLTIDTTQDFLRATRLANVTVQSPGDVLIDGRNDTGDVVYGMQHSVQQVSLTTDATGISYGTPIVGIDGSLLPLSPAQAAQLNFTVRLPAINGAAEVDRQEDRTYLVADTLNDRIFVFDKKGEFISGLASNNVRSITTLYPLTASYNSTNSTLYVAWSTNLSLTTMDLTQITISGTGLSITLSNTADQVVKLVGPNTQNAASNVSPILLSTAHAGAISAYLGDATITDQSLFITIGATAAKEGLDVSNTNFATLVGPRGMPIFVGDLVFVQGIYHPVSVNVTSTGTWLVGNAKPLLTTGTSMDSTGNSTGGTDPLTGMSVSDITSVIEIDPATGAILFSDNSVDFSLLTIGAVVELSAQYIVEAGIVQAKPLPTATSTNSITATVGGGVVQTSSTVTSEATAVAAGTGAASASSSSTTTTTTDVDVLNNRSGIVKIIERSSGRVIYQQPTSDGTYAADAQIDADGHIVTIEKSFANGTSAGRVVKLDDDGNVFFEFGLQELASPNDVRVLSTGNLIVST